MPLWLDDKPPRSDYRSHTTTAEAAAALILLFVFLSFLLGYWIGGCT